MNTVTTELDRYAQELMWAKKVYFEEWRPRQIAMALNDPQCRQTEAEIYAHWKHKESNPDYWEFIIPRMRLWREDHPNKKEIEKT